MDENNVYNKTKMIIGITGSIGSGKTTAANIFKRYKFEVVNVDRLYHKIYNENNQLKNKIKHEFGTANRSDLKKIVFNDFKKLKKLNHIAHPIIIKETKKIIQKIKKDNPKKIIVIDSPLLLETGAKDLVGKIIVVRCDSENIINRNKKFSKEEIERILKLQMPLKEKLKHADFVVDNNKDVKYLERQIKKIVKILTG